MLFTLLAVSLAAAQSAEDYATLSYPDKDTSCDEISFTGDLRLSSDFKQTETLTVTIEDSGGWSRPPYISKTGRTDVTLDPAETSVLRLLDGDRASSSKSAWIDLAVSSDYGTSVRRIYAGPAADIQSLVWQPEDLPLESIAAGEFTHEAKVTCGSEVPLGILEIDITVEDATIESIYTHGRQAALVDELVSSTTARVVIECDGSTYLVSTIGYLASPKEGGRLRVSLRENGLFSQTLNMEAGSCDDPWVNLEGYGAWPEIAELLEGYEVVEGEDGELILLPEGLTEAWGKGDLDELSEEPTEEK